MVLSTAEKHSIVEKFQRNNKDTGSAEVQIALLSNEISRLTEHFKTHKQDHHSRQGLLRKVNQRRKLLTYLQRKQPDAYTRLIADLGLRG
jgi:small subunit ribosomal protein S15